jgi:hypothetical protein
VYGSWANARGELRGDASTPVMVTDSQRNRREEMFAKTFERVDLCFIESRELVLNGYPLLISKSGAVYAAR